MHILNYINGTMQAALSGDTLDNFEPATGHVYGQIADSDSADAVSYTHLRAHET